MKQLLLMFVILTTSIINAQTFDFGCETLTPFQSDLAAIYADGTTPPVLTDLINNTSDTVEASNNSGDFFKSLGADSGYTVASFGGDTIGFFFRIDAIDAPKIYSEVENINTPAGHRAFTLQIVKHIWDLLYPNYVDPAALRAERIAQITALDNASANVVITIVQVENLGEAFRISGSNIEHDFPTGIFESGVTLFERLGDTQWTEMKLRISNKINEIDNAAELAELRTVRINQLDGYVDGPVTVTHGTADGSDAFTVSGGEGNPQTFVIETLYGTEKVENLEISEFDNLVADILAKVDELNPLSDYNLEIELEDFYAKVNIHDINTGALYGDQLTDVIEQLANLAEASDDNDVIEEFLKKLSKGAIHQGLDSYLEWYPDTNIIVTNNGGVSNGFYDIPITDLAYLGPTGLWQLNQLSASNVRHLAYHIMWNFWNLANQDAAALSTFRLQALVVKANSRGWFVREHTTDAGVHYYEPRAGADVAISGFGTLIVSGFQSNAVTLGDLTAANWETFYNKWVEKIDESI